MIDDIRATPAHEICRACETQSHCSRNGCIPVTMADQEARDAAMFEDGLFLLGDPL